MNFRGIRDVRVNKSRGAGRAPVGHAKGCVEPLEPRSYLSVSFPQGVPYAGLRANYVAVADLNGDGKPDIVAVGTDTNSGTTGVVAVFVNKGAGTYGSPILLPWSGSDDIGAVAIGDFNGDGVPDIAVEDAANATVTVYLGAGTNVDGTNPSYLSPVTTSFGTPGDSVGIDTEFAVGHFGGTSADLVVWDQAAGGILVLPSTGQGHFGTPIPITNSLFNIADQNVSAFAVADFSGDGISDIAYGIEDTVYVQFGASGGSFLTTAYPYSLPNDLTEQVAAGVLTSSGKPDLVVANDTPADSAFDVSVLLNNGGGSFSQAVNYPVADDISEALGDFDGNGSLDVAVPDPGVGIQVLLNTGSGTLEDAANVSLADSDPVNMVAADLNSDGKADLVVPDTLGLGAGSANDLGVFLEGASSTSGGGGSTGGAEFSVGVSGRLPTAILIAGEKNPAFSQTVKITNTTGATVKGPVTVILSIDGSQVADESRTVNVAKNRSLSLPILIRTIPAGISGTFNVVAQVTDPGGTTTSSSSSGTVTAEPATVDLSGAFAHIPTSVKAGHKGTVVLTVAQGGNITAAGALEIHLTATDTSTNTVVDLGTVTRTVRIAAGRHVSESIPLTFPTSGGPFLLTATLDPNNTFNDVNLSNNTFSSSVAVTLT